jgi:hypothetical protein
MYDHELVQGTKYIITDHPNDMGIIVEAASSSQISQYALRLACQPKYYVAGPYMTGSGGTVEEYWNGVYEYGSTPTQGDIYIYAGMVYKNLTGDDATPPGEYILNSTDWELKTVEWGDYYSPNICEVIYKIGLTTSPVDEPCGVVQRQTDINNNTFGQALTGDPTLAQRTRIDYNDWGHPNIRSCELINCWSNKEDCKFIGVRGYGQVYRNKTTNLNSVRITDDSVLIYDNTLLTVFDCDISGNVLLNNGLTIIYSELNSLVSSNNSLTITDCESNSPITGNSSSSIKWSYIFGAFRGNETCDVRGCTFESEISGNDTCDFVNVNNYYSSASMKNNRDTTFTNVTIFSTYVGVFTGVSNNTKCTFTNLQLYGAICNNIRCEIVDFRIESSYAYVYDCDDLLILNSYLSGFSWIKTVSGTAPETRSQIVGCAINGELELLGEGAGGTVVTITDCVIGKSGDIKSVKAGTFAECTINGDFKRIDSATVNQSVIEAKTDIKDITTLLITNSQIGHEVNMNLSIAAAMSITRCVIHSYSTVTSSTLVDSELSGTISGTITRCVILNSTVSGTMTDSIIHDSTVSVTEMTNSRIFNSTVNGGVITNSEIYSSFAGTITNSIVEAGATIYAISLDCLNISNSRIGSRADIFKDDYGTLTITDCDFNGKYECNASSDNNETLTRCKVEYGATILDTLNLTLEDCKLLYGAKLSLTEFYTHKLYKTIIDYDATSPVLYDLSGDTTLGDIGACAYITGSIEIEDAATVGGNGYNVVASGTSLSATTVKENGASISINSTGKWIEIIVDSPGWYNIHYLASAKSNTATDVETAAFFSSIMQPQINNIKSYIIQDVSTARYNNSSLDGKIYFEDSTPLKFLYKSAVDVQLTIYKITINVEKEL